MAKANWPKHVPPFWSTLVVSAVLRVGLILYSEWHDAHSGVKYTDVDYRVFSDAARFLLHPNRTQLDNAARGPVARRLALHIGRRVTLNLFRWPSPYTRETYRYTPLLALLLLPNELLHPSFGKYLFAACDLVNGALIHQILLTSLPLRGNKSSAPLPGNEGQTVVQVQDTQSTRERDAMATLLAGTHLLNPLVFSISTRGSSESILCTFILLTLYFALKRQWDTAAILLGVSTHWKIYPVIYGVSCVTAIASQTRGANKGHRLLQGLFCKESIRFAVVSASTFFILGALCYAIWGYPFLHEAFLYHLHRLDHRHNFSPYFYLTYLTYPGQGSEDLLDIPLWRLFLRSPLTSFIPQLTLSLGFGILFAQHRVDLPFAWFAQTYAFVLFNRVCTSQYFLWYTLFLPLIAPRIRSPWLCAVVWFGTQALWLAEAYRLEFLGENVHFGLWLRGLTYLAGHAWVLAKVIDDYTMNTTYITCR
ncbi:glycosyltransferase family 50 protein [Pisolithus croceorrhizus]|nr:glycosyltransferase family 50 protein [Pisolithus croceorrhizus]